MEYYTTESRYPSSITNQDGGDGYRTAPTFYPVADGVYGKQHYNFGDIVTQKTYEAYQTYANAAQIGEHLEEVYVATKTVTYKYDYTYLDGNEYKTVEKTATANKGTAIPKTKITEWISGSVNDLQPAKVCVNTLKLAEGVYLGNGELKTADEITALKQYAYSHDGEGHTIEDKKLIDAIDAAMVDAYFCNKEGTFGGQQFYKNKNYGAVEAWCGLPKSERQNNGVDQFIFNQDAFDLLANKDYLQYDGTSADYTYPKRTIADEESGEVSTERAFGPVYSNTVKVEYVAINKNNPEDVLTNEQYVALRNDQRHYTRVDLDKAQKIYVVVAEGFIDNGEPYGKGQIVDEDLYDRYKTTGEIIETTQTLPVGISYYRYETYGDDPYTSHDDGGYVISETEYNNVKSNSNPDGKLVNEQKDYIIQGKEPVETTNLYVSGESDIFDVSKERVYSVVYQYTYYENEGNNIKQTNELHIVNVHIQMESGVPIIGPLAVPDVVIPGDAVTMRTPDVTVGTYPPLGNGWEIFSNWDDASMNRNGIPYENGVDPLYWYQNGDYYINFYSKNYLGKIYAPKAMPLRVANYHDLDAVMYDKEHHMYVDRADVDRPSKIYIDNRECLSDATKSELDLLKDFFDLSLQTATAEETTYTIDETVHNRMNTHVHGARNLEFILQSDVSPKKYTDWNSIGTKTVGETPGQCFEGNLHGDGYTISGLTSSLFNNLCGEVYNLGVTGTFTSSGIVEEGTGYLENCWVKKTNAGAVTSGTKALFGSTTDTESRTVHMVNCYYPQENGYTAQTGATEKPLKAFYNGEVAYNLNDFYLFKRYSDHKSLSGTDTYKYYKTTLTGVEGEKTNDNATLSLVEDARYEADDGRTGPYLLSDDNNRFIGSYVEWRYADGDFMYASGSVPSAKNERVYTVTDGNNKTEYYYPIWPDDYIFFGQALNYNHVEGLTHQAEPSVINKLGGRLVDTNEGNRVYRAPAYFGSSTKSVAHFNSYAVFAQSEKDDATVEAYKGMTAIDFSGGNGDLSGGYQFGQKAQGFCLPLLDDDGITDFTNVDLTRNLLVYTDAINASATTENTVKTKLIEETYQETDDAYHTVAEANNLRQEKTVRGHWVQKVSAAYMATRDHYLVDKEEFNSPIEYRFDDTHRMWYQRIPDNYVGKKNAAGTGFIDNGAGWEGVSLPFTAEIVTTNTKGEITHFYNYTDDDENHSKGHEYWLRKFEGGAMKSGSTDIFEATFNKPSEGTVDKTYTNTFLWDYYYSINNREDLNTDQYPDASYKYYSVSHDYTNYPRLANATPYIIGFPGERYYEFDLSGEFEAKTALVTPAKLTAQIITFASAAGATIGVSDTELTTAMTAATENGYTFVPNYASKTLGNIAYILNERKVNPAATEGGDDTIIEAGSRYEKTTSPDPATTIPVVPFRPYFMAATNGAREKTRSIVFSDEQTQLEGEDEAPKDNEIGGTLNIYAKRKKIVVSSTLSYTADLRIVTPAGITVSTFSVKPGETVEVRADFSGMYIVHTLDGQYMKKVVIKRE